jgi:hypothetical protein
MNRTRVLVIIDIEGVIQRHGCGQHGYEHAGECRSREQTAPSFAEAPFATGARGSGAAELKDDRSRSAGGEGDREPKQARLPRGTGDLSCIRCSV